MLLLFERLYVIKAMFIYLGDLFIRIYLQLRDMLILFERLYAIIPMFVGDLSAAEGYFLYCLEGFVSL